MHRPRYYYMRFSAICMFLIVSAAILVSYANVPHYRLHQSAANHYWLALAQLLMIAIAYLVYAFSLERPDRPINPTYHCLAAAVILLVCVKFTGLIHLALVSV